MDIKKVWFVSHYTMPPEFEMRVKTLKYAYYLGLKGIDCTIFAASTIHNTNINLIKDNSLYIERTYGDFKYVHIRCSDYTKNDLKRIINMEQFGYRFAKVAEKFDAPDVIVSDVYCVSYKPIYKYCKKHNIPFVIDVRDLWPLSIVEYLHFKETNPIIRILYKMERNMYIRANRIIFSMEGGYDYIQDRHLDTVIPRNKVFFINNGVDNEEFKRNAGLYTIDDPDLCNESLYKVVYVGSIRKVNNLGSLIDAAKKVNDEKVRFLIWGDGDELENLKERVQNEKIDNVIFKGKVEKKYIPYIASHADLNLMHGNPAKLFKYGISPNKLFDYLAAGKPVLSTFPCKYNPAVMYGAGVAVEEQTPEAIALEIGKLMQFDNTEYSNNANRAAERYDLKVLTDELLTILEEL